MSSYHWNIGKMEFWNIGCNRMEIKELVSGPVFMLFWFVSIIPIFHHSIIPTPFLQ